jgi:pimeloyl-ACP methyl ester carboxylesterase
MSAARRTLALMGLAVVLSPASAQAGFAQQAYVKATDSAEGVEFGRAVAVDGNTMVAGGLFAGAAYVYVRSGTNWNLQARLIGSNTETNRAESDAFGYTAAIDGDTVVIGAINESSGAAGVNGDQNDNSVPWAGAAYVFVRDGTTWSQQAYLKSDNPQPGVFFGGSVGISGNTVVIGERQTLNPTNAPGTPAELADGGAFVFVREGTNWSQQARLTPLITPGRMIYYFGGWVGISGDTLAASAADVPITGEIETATVSMFIYVRNGSTWSRQAVISDRANASADPGIGFNRNIALSGDTLVVGALQDESLSYTGVANVYTRSGNTWRLQAQLKASNAEDGDSFSGWTMSLALSGDTLVVGAPGESSGATGINGDQNDNSVTWAGAAYVFLRTGTNWSQQTYLKASNPDEFDAFGAAVAVSGGMVVVGAPGESSNATGVNGTQTNNLLPFAGAAYVFQRVPPHPVIFIHGVAGGVLKTDIPLLGSHQFWPTLNPVDVGMLNLQTGPTFVDAVDVVREFHGPFYGTFIQFMVDNNGYTEFDLAGDRARMTNDYMITHATDPKPTLFVFPYDWRRSNATHAQTLNAYIQRIRQLHNGAKVALVVHSMGGLVMRRYLLDFGTNDIDRVVTVGSPILGAVQPIYRMLSGAFYDILPIDDINSTRMKAALAVMPGVHELLPSPTYLQNVGSPVFAETGYDINNNGIREEIYDDTALHAMLDAQANPGTPTLDNVNFHGYLGARQDNWSADAPGLKFLQIIGKQAVKATTVRVNVQHGLRLGLLTFPLPLVSVIPTVRYDLVRGDGDGTVPLLSSGRLPDLLAPGTVIRQIEEPEKNKKSEDQAPGNSAEHTGLMSNTRTYDLLTQFLDGEPAPTTFSRGTSSSPLKEEPQAARPKSREREPVPLDSPEIGEAVDAPQLTWISGGDFPWGAQTNTTHDGQDAAQSGPFSSTMRTTVEGPVLVTFWWSESSDAEIGTLTFTVDDVEQPSVPAITGNVDWRQETVSIPAGSHALRWIYESSSGGGSSVSRNKAARIGVGVNSIGVLAGGDAGWVDEVVVVPAPADIDVMNGRVSLVDGAATSDFGSVALGESNTVVYALWNRGALALSGIAGTVSGTNSDCFRVGEPGTNNVAAGTNTEIAVTFIPTDGMTSDRIATLHIASNDPDENPFDIALIGQTAIGSRRVYVDGVGYIHLRDGLGRENTRLSEIAADRIPGIDARYGGEDLWVALDFLIDKDLTLDADATTQPFDITITDYTAGGTPVRLVRYRFFPDNHPWRLFLPSVGLPDLRLDTNGDTNFVPGEVLAPAYSVAGASIDTTDPMIAMTLATSSNGVAVTLTGADDPQPSPSLRYTVDDGAIQTYTDILNFPNGPARTLKAYAEDAVGNFSGLIETTLHPALGLQPGGGQALTVQWPSMDGGYVMEESTTLRDPWTPVTAPVIPSGIVNRITIPAGTNRVNFYRLRFQPVAR